MYSFVLSLSKHAERICETAPVAAKMHNDRKKGKALDLLRIFELLCGKLSIAFDRLLV